MPVFDDLTPARCLHCPDHPTMARRYDGTGAGARVANPLFGLASLNENRTSLQGGQPMLVRVYACWGCGSLALFSQDIAHNYQLEAQATAAQIARGILEQQGITPDF